MAKIVFLLSILGTILVCGCKNETQENGESVIQGQEPQTSTDLLSNIVGTWEANDCNRDSFLKITYDPSSEKIIKEETHYGNTRDCQNKIDPVYHSREEFSGPFEVNFLGQALAEKMKRMVYAYRPYNEDTVAYSLLGCDKNSVILYRWSICKEESRVEHQNGGNVTIFALNNLWSYYVFNDGIHFTESALEYTRVQ